jgi:thioredoxin-dependent peroxiredoxin
VILGASFDPVVANCAFAEKFDFPFKLLSDEDKALGIAYGAAADASAAAPRRISYLIGPDGVVRKAYPKVKPADHPAEVLADLAALT